MGGTMRKLWIEEERHMDRQLLLWENFFTLKSLAPLLAICGVCNWKLEGSLKVEKF